MPRSKKRKGRSSKRAPRSHGRRLLRVLAIGVGLLCVATIVPIALLRFIPPPTTAFMLESYHRDPATGRACSEVDYAWTPRRAIAADVPRAILVAEDQRFLEHHGFDTKAIGEALDDYAAGGSMRGASTVSQQVAKNLFLWPGRSFVRKGLEAWLTVWIELLWPKQRIIEVHVNVAQFGPCVFGVEAAALRYFGVHASALSASEAALLAAVLPAPGRMHLDRPGPFTKERAREILDELQKDGGPAYLRGL